jgi:hypothetical protein
MKLTPDQEAWLRHAKAAREKRVTLPITAEQIEEWRKAVQEELAGKAENIAQIRKVEAAAEQPGFSATSGERLSYRDALLRNWPRRRASPRVCSPTFELGRRNCRLQPWTG